MKTKSKNTKKKTKHLKSNLGSNLSSNLGSKVSKLAKRNYGKIHISDYMIEKFVQKNCK
jgi:hypothetical protein